MATFWVSTLGSDANPGTGPGPADAKLTIAAGIALLTNKGDKLNVINDGTHTWPTAETDRSTGAGTSYDADPGFIIQGTDSAGNAAMTTIAASGGDAARFGVRFRNGTAYNTVQNFILDATGKRTDASTYNFVRLRDNGAEHTRVRYCVLLGATTGLIHSGSRFIYAIDTAGSSTDTGYVEYCYFQNCLRPLPDGWGGAQTRFKVRRCLWINNANVARSGALCSLGAPGVSQTGNLNEFYNCTIWDEAGATNAPAVFSYRPALNVNVGTLNAHSNVVYYNSTNASLATLFQGSATATGVTHAGTIGYNVMLYGPDIASGDLVADGSYQLPWDPDDNTLTNDIYATDTRVFQTVAATYFKDPTATYSWELPNGLTVTILKDLRLITLTDTGLDGGPPGALPAAVTDYVATLSADTTAPAPGEAVGITATLANSGVNATSVVATLTIPAGITISNVVVSAGSYAAGVWTIGNLNSGATATMTATATIGADQSGASLALTFGFTSGVPDSDAPTADDTATVTFSVLDTDDPAIPGGAGEIPYIDVLPILFPDLRMKINARLSTTINRIVRRYVRVDVENHRWREFTTKQITVAANTTLTINLGGIERARYFFLRADTAVQVSQTASGDTFFPAATAVVLVGGDFQTIRIKNPSLTASVAVFLAAVD